MKCPKDEAQRQLDFSKVWEGQVYRHYKGGLYVVITTAINELTLEPVVVYRSCTHATFWTRSLSGFMGKVVKPGTRSTKILRFEIVQ